MKRWIALFVLMVLMAPAALAATWEDGRSPAKPYVGVPEVDLSKTLGYMMFYPNSKMSAEHIGRELRIYLPRRDVEAGKGRAYLCTEAEGELLRFSFKDEEYVTMRDMTEAELDSMLWGDGVCFEITLPVSLNLGTSYFVNLDKNCIVTTKGKVGNAIIGGTDSWAFTVEGEYGVSGLSYRRAARNGDMKPVTKPAAGDEVTFELTLGGEAAAAALFCWDDSVAFDKPLLRESMTVTGQILTDNPAWGIVFMDANGNELWQETF